MPWIMKQWIREILEKRELAKKVQSIDKLKKERERLMDAREKKRT